MSPTIITSAQNPTFKALLALAEEPRTRRSEGLWVEGAKVLGAALQAGCTIKTLVATDEALPALEPLKTIKAQAEPDAAPQTLPLPEPLLLAPGLFKRLSLMASPQGIAAWVLPPSPRPLDGRQDLLLLDRLQDPGNVGTLLRTAAAAGIRQAVLLAGSTEAHSPKALRAGMGAQFSMAIHEGVLWESLDTTFPGPWVATVAPSHPGAVNLYEADLHRCPAVVWCFGQEGQGLGAGLLQHPRAMHLTIPQSAAVESLNVSAAAAVCLFERLRQTKTRA